MKDRARGLGGLQEGLLASTFPLQSPTGLCMSSDAQDTRPHALRGAEHVKTRKHSSSSSSQGTVCTWPGTWGFLSEMLQCKLGHCPSPSILPSPAAGVRSTYSDCVLISLPPWDSIDTGINYLERAVDSRHFSALVCACVYRGSLHVSGVIPNQN